jgi:hypothetical protein
MWYSTPLGQCPTTMRIAVTVMIARSALSPSSSAPSARRKATEPALPSLRWDGNDRTRRRTMPDRSSANFSVNRLGSLHTLRRTPFEHTFLGRKGIGEEPVSASIGATGSRAMLAQRTGFKLPFDLDHSSAG